VISFRVFWYDDLNFEDEKIIRGRCLRKRGDREREIYKWCGGYNRNMIKLAYELFRDSRV